VIPYSFVVNLHYAAPALLAGALAGAIALARWRWAWVLPAVGVVAVGTGIGRGRGIAIWSSEMGGAGFALLLVATVVGGAAALAWLQPSLRRLARPGAVAATAIVVVAVAVIARHYPARRSTDPVAHWAATVRGARIAAWVTNPGDLYGPRAQNDVEIMSRLRDGAAVPIDTCQEWKRAVRDGHFAYAAVTADTPWSRWQEADPAFRLVADERVGARLDDYQSLRRYMTVVFRVVGSPDVSCPGQVDTVSSP
jgi:hypothetical protein